MKGLTLFDGREQVSEYRIDSKGIRQAHKGSQSLTRARINPTVLDTQVSDSEIGL